MKNILKRLFVLLLCTTLIFNTCVVTVYAGEELTPEQKKKKEEIAKMLGFPSLEDFEKPSNPPKDMETLKNFFNWYIAQQGAVGDFEKISENNEAFNEKLKEIWTSDNIKVQFSKDSLKPNIVFSKTLSDKVLEMMKDATKDSDNGGYELVKTVPVSKLQRSWFATDAQYATVFNLLKDNKGAIGLTKSANSGAMMFYKIDTSAVWVKGKTASYSINGVAHDFQKYNTYRNVNEYFYLDGVVAKSYDVPVKSWDDSENLMGAASSFRAYTFYTYDEFVKAKGLFTNPLETSKVSYSPYIVTNTGVSIPVFNSVDDAVNYSVVNALYYTTSDFTGEGKEITIDDDELAKILDGYYSGMYDMLQKLIEQNGGNTLTPEQLQELVDQVVKSIKDGLGDLGAETEETNN